MKPAVDSSAFTKKYMQEVRSDKLGLFIDRAPELGLCIILVPEIISGLNRRLREKMLCDEDYRSVKRQFSAAVNAGLNAEFIGDSEN